MPPSAFIRTFRAADDPALFAAYLEMKYRVFAQELGWSALNVQGGSAAADAFDHSAVFACAELGDGSGRNPLGFARGIVAQPLPNERLFGAEPAALRATDATLGSINSLMVAPEHRGKVLDFGAGMGRAKASAALLRQLIGTLQELGADVLLVTAVLGPSASRFRSEGFRGDASPFALSGHAVVNMSRRISDAGILRRHSAR
jgi:hypothetical protein